MDLDSLSRITNGGLDILLRSGMIGVRFFRISCLDNHVSFAGL